MVRRYSYPASHGARLRQRIRRLKIYLNTGQVLRPAKYLVPDFYLTISGIPAAIHIDNYFARRPASFDDPEEPDYAVYTITDKNGYVANWLYEKLTPKNQNRLYAKLLDELRKAKYTNEGTTPHIGHY